MVSAEGACCRSLGTSVTLDFIFPKRSQPYVSDGQSILARKTVARSQQGSSKVLLETRTRKRGH